jgi:hypothetical protein
MAKISLLSFGIISNFPHFWLRPGAPIAFDIQPFNEILRVEERFAGQYQPAELFMNLGCEFSSPPFKFSGLDRT